MDEARIDKWLWTVRLFKTRSVASEACKKGRVMIDNVSVKPSRNLKIGDKVDIWRPPVTYSFKVKGFPKNRIGAKLLPEYIEDITPKDQLEILELQKLNGFVGRPKGTGRPTKKERRNMDEIFGWDNWDEDIEL